MLPGLGNGKFDALSEAAFAVGPTVKNGIVLPIQIIVDDFDHDGRPDLAITWWLNTIHPKFGVTVALSR